MKELQVRGTTGQRHSGGQQNTTSVSTLTVADYDLTDMRYGGEFLLTPDGSSTLLELLQAEAPWDLMETYTLEEPPEDNQLSLAVVPSAGATVRVLLTARIDCQDPVT